MPKNGFRSITVNETLYRYYYTMYTKARLETDNGLYPYSFTEWIEKKLMSHETAVQRLAKKIKIPNEFLNKNGKIRPRVYNKKYDCYLVDREGGYD